MSLALAIVTAGHRPERQALYDRLVDRLNMPPIPFLKVAEKAPHWIWSEVAWSFLANADATHGLLLQDDVLPCPDFWAVLDKVIAARPNDIIALNNCQLGPSPSEAERLKLQWVVSHDGLVGHGYVLPKAGWKSLLEWRATQLVPGAIERVSEDILIDVYAMHTGRLIWHPVPALIDHDDTTESTWNNPHDPQSLRAIVPPREGMLDIKWDTDAVHAGRVKHANHRLLITEMGGQDYRARVERYFALEGGRA